MNYICSFKDFKETHTGDDFTILTTSKLDNKYNVPVIHVEWNPWRDAEYAYSEGYVIRYIYEHTHDEWVGVSQYRRYFKEYYPDKTILPVPLKFNMNEQYRKCHNINDLLQCERIIDEYYPEFSMDYDSINILYHCNMFHMKREDFEEWYKFVFGVIDKFKEENKLYTDEDVQKYVTSNLDKYSDKRVSYQSRLFGFLMERLSNIFFIKWFKDKEVTYQPIIITQEKL